MNIAVIGSGYVGLVAAASFAELGHQVILVDNDQRKLQLLRDGNCPIHEEFLPELLRKHSASRLTFSGDLNSAVAASTAIFIAVGTPPSASGEADLSYVESVAREIARALNGFKVIIEKSTVPVYTNEWIRRIVLLNGGTEDQFEIVSNPEFLREGTAVTDFLYPDRIVVGANSQRARDLLREIYLPLTSGAYHRRQDAIPGPHPTPASIPLIETSAKSAELIKHASNAFLALKISFINAVANICEAVDADIEEVCQGLGSDSRIGPRFLKAGLGYGGSCFPKDIAAFRSVAAQYGYDFRLLDEVCAINEDQRKRFLRKVRTALWTLKGKRLAVLGLSFKGGTDDIRESPAMAIIDMLLAEGSFVSAYDPAAMTNARALADAELSTRVRLADDCYSALDGADALLILTDWEEFADLDLDLVREKLQYPIVIDGRNLYLPAQMAAAGLIYHSVGRPASKNPRPASSKMQAAN